MCSFHVLTLKNLWRYSLELTALEGESVVLEDMEAEIGKSNSTELILENPLGVDIELLVHVSNPINFKFVAPTERSRGSGNYGSIQEKRHKYIIDIGRS